MRCNSHRCHEERIRRKAGDRIRHAKYLSCEKRGKEKREVMSCKIIRRIIMPPTQTETKNVTVSV